ncbi:DUF2971 domain-containing protein [Ochrobactrum sp. Marseille-Q0166]|uniref:DUF2971 domain-containing protein n=1 Tax=Ochrobactrum sp. Marseille-Q0166 TaxID=2761105 RepID=UPI0016554080|nr:DUF2971 domain-containing protein [Ochrobactrum sp. Marseille-Q0166]MBC8719890.1 DUF2971 domain-containing protein [Ochrobactrum sp. Marseille-Q0166]
MTSDSHFCNAVFRYRSIQSLLGEHEELERQTVYFSPPEYLNDPMEGLRQIYWRGDRVTWRNLLRHYIICIHNRFFEALLSRDTECLPSDTIAVFQSLHNFPTSQVKSLCQACITAVEASDLHTALLDFLAKADRDISFTELQQLLRAVHLDWLYLIQKAFEDRALVPSTDGGPPDSAAAVKVIRTLQATNPEIREKYSIIGLDVIHEVQQHMAQQMTILTAIENANSLNPKRESLFFEFTSEYLSNLLKLVYPPWFVACFSTRHDNAAMWSYYADNHRGCCLVFRKQQTTGGMQLRLHGPNGYGARGITRSSQNMPLEPVCYAVQEQQIEFFTNIGRLPVEQLRRDWFSDYEGNISTLAEHLNQDKQESWRSGYWGNFAPPLLRKLPDWRHEEELRIVISDILGIHETPEGRTYTYDYDTLDGIIFGINTSLSDKVRIMQILDKKLGARTVSEPFKFFQARYNARSGCIETHHMSLLQHKRT